MQRVSVLLPTFKEEGIGASLDRLTAHLSKLDAAFEVILIDDSPEPFREAIRAYIAANAECLGPKIEVRLLEGDKTGKGGAIRAGALASTGDVVFTMDADLPIPLHHIEEFLAIFARTGCDAVIAERPFDRNLREPLRFVLSRGLFVFQRALVFQSSEFLDTQCGFKAYRGEVIRSIASRQIVDGGMYDIEYLYIATLDHRKIERVRVTPNAEIRASKINVWKCIYTDPMDLFRVKAKGIAGGYKR